MVDRHIVKALVEVALFLELSDDETIDPDSAVAAMEQMAANLQALDAPSRRALALEMRSLADSYPTSEQFVRNLPDALGIATE